MPKEKKESSTVDFLNNISPEPFKEEEVQTPKEEEEDDNSPTGEEKSLPFHKSPKVQRYVEKQIEKALKGQPVETQFRKDVEEDMGLPPALVRIVGNDTPEKQEALREFDKYLKGLKGEARQEFLDEMKQQEQAQVAEDNAALEELSTGFEEIEDQYGVDLDSDLKTRAAFIEFLRKASHKNADGEVDQFADIPSTWEIFQSTQRAAPASRAKELATRGMTRSTDTGTAPVTGRSWKDVDRMFAKLEAKN